MKELVRTVGGDLNEKWRATFEGGKDAYTKLKFVLYDKPMPISGCTRVARPERGPFYCGKTQSVYYPISWVAPRGHESPQEMGDFAVAVILGHEAGHYVQSLLEDPRGHEPLHHPGRAAGRLSRRDLGMFCLSGGLARAQ